MLHLDRSAVPEGFDWGRGGTYTTRDRLPAGAAPQRFQTWNQPELLAGLDCTVEVKERVDTWGNTLLTAGCRNQKQGCGSTLVLECNFGY